MPKNKIDDKKSEHTKNIDSLEIKMLAITSNIPSPYFEHPNKNIMR